MEMEIEIDVYIDQIVAQIIEQDCLSDLMYSILAKLEGNENKYLCCSKQKQKEFMKRLSKMQDVSF